MAKKDRAERRGSSETRSVTFRLPVETSNKLDGMAQRARLDRKQVLIRLINLESAKETPALACLAELLRLHHRLDREGSLNSNLRADISAAVQGLVLLTRRELDE